MIVSEERLRRDMWRAAQDAVDPNETDERRNLSVGVFVAYAALLGLDLIVYAIPLGRTYQGRDENDERIG